MALWLTIISGGLIVFNPLDVPQPELRAGGQLMPTEPNRQLIIVVNKGVIKKKNHYTWEKRP